MHLYDRLKLSDCRSVVAWGLCVIAVLTVPLSSSLAFIDDVYMGPGSPDNTDLVYVKVVGWYPDLCWYPQGASVRQSDDTIYVTSHAIYDPGTTCLPMLRDYSDSVVFGPLAPGNYTVVVSDSTPDYETLSLTVSSNPDCCQGMRGNVDGSLDDVLDISDIVFLVDYMFDDGPTPPCLEEADIDGSGILDIADLVYLVDYMFNQGPAPVECP
jgi:hypothetical protein